MVVLLQTLCRLKLCYFRSFYIVHILKSLDYASNAFQSITIAVWWEKNQQYESNVCDEQQIVFTTMMSPELQTALLYRPRRADTVLWKSA